MPDIVIQKLHKSYGAHVAVSDIDLHIPDGTFCVLLGPSGCGKSTTLNCLAGLEDVSAGTIAFGGQDVTHLPPHERNIAMVFQSSLLYPHLNAMQNIRMSLRGLKSDPQEVDKRISEALTMLEITDLVDKKPAQMSGGERQRVAMAKAVVRNPTAFLMDEPLAALDAALRQSLRADLVRLQRQLGVTTVFVTHDQIEAMTMGDLIVVMNKGRIEQVGTAQEIYNQPKTRFVASFLDSPPMNFIKGHLVQEGERPMLHLMSAQFALPLSATLKQYNGEIEVGIRPQHLTLHGQFDAGTLPATVFSIEYLGKENVILLEDEGRNIIRLLTEATVAPQIGEKVFLKPDVERLHYFKP